MSKVLDTRAHEAKPGLAERRATRLIFLLCGMAQSSWAPLVPYAKARVHADDRSFGLLLLCFGAGSLVAMPTFGALANHYGCKRLIQASSAGIFLGLLAVAAAPSAPLLAMALLVFGASIGSLDVVMNVQALLVERASGENLMSGFHGLYSVGGFAGALLMGALLSADLSAAQASLWTIILLAALLFVANPSLLPFADRRQDSSGGSLWPERYVVFLAALTFIVFLAEGSMLDWSAVFLVERAGLADKHAGAGYAAFSIAMTASRFGGAALVRRLGRTTTMTAGALLAGGGLLLAAELASAPWSVVGFALVGLGAANLVPLLFSLVSESGGALGRTLSFVTTVGYAGILAGPALIGFVVHAKGFGVAFGGVACSLLFVGLLAPVASRRGRPKSAAAR